MSDWIWPFFEELRQSFRIADAIDIALITLLLYAVLVWFRTTASRNLAIGVSVLAVLYFVASALDLYLTLLAFHGAFAVLLVVLVVVFQEDLRRMLERVARWGALPKRPATPADQVEFNVLIEAIFRLAETRTGALIVIKGREPLDRHLDGGIPLDGQLSKPLIYSIFDASSPGHDGAVVIEASRIKAFGAHLPISKNQAEIHGRGTRHSAALGLSELSDAVVIVVSEERGVVSVAEGGTLHECRSAAELKGRVEEFFETHFPREPRQIRQFVLHHWQLKLIALATAILAWFTFAYHPGTIQRTFVAQVEYRKVPPGLLVGELASTEAKITLSGLERGFRFLDPSTLKITVDLTGYTVGNYQVPVTDKEVRIPANLTIYRIEPRQLYVPLKENRAATDDAIPVPTVPTGPEVQL